MDWERMYNIDDFITSANKLYLITQTENTNYDTYDSAVVCAPDEETARLTQPGGEGWKWGEKHFPWCASPDKVAVVLLGYALEGVPLGVVCASFNAG